MWIAQGSAQSIVATPAVPPPNTVGPNSLQMVEAAGTRSYIYTTGSFPRIPAGTLFDLYFTLDVTSQAMNAYDLTTFLTPSNAADGSEYPAQISFAYDGTNFQLQASGSSFTSKLNLSLNAWHTVQLHVESGANASFMVVDGGAPASFTANASDFAYLVVGSTLGELDAITYYIGNVYVNSALGGGPPPSTYIDFEASTDGMTITTDILAASTHCGNGVWSLATSPITGMTISTDAQKQLPSPVTTCGTQYADATGTRGLRYDISQTGQYAAYTWSATSGSASAGFFYKITVNDTNYYSVFSINGQSGLDFSALNIHDGAMRLEVGSQVISAPINISPNTWYWVTMQYNAGGTHRLQVYDTTSWVLLGDLSNAATGNDAPTSISIGRTGSEPGFPSGYWYYDNIIVDYLTAEFPIVPTVATAQAGDFTMAASPASTTVTAGGATSYTASISPTGGFTGQVTLSVSGLPSGASGSFNPNPATTSSTLSVTTSTSTPAGTYTLTITGVSGALTHTTTASLTVAVAQTAMVGYDNTVSSGFQWGVTTASTPAFTIGSGTNRAAMIMVAMSANNASNITASLGGVNGTMVPGSDSGTTATIRTLIFQVINPPSGAQTATVSWTTSMNVDVGVIVVSGADQTTPCTNGTFTANNSTPTTTASVTISSNPGDLTASIGYTTDAWVTPFTNQTLRWGVDSAAVGGDIGPGTGTTTHTWTGQYFYLTTTVSGANFKAAIQ